MAPPGGKDLTLTVYGLDAIGNEVYADVFAAKLARLIKGLKKVDRYYNSGKRHSYVIADLTKGSASVALREKLVSTEPVRRQPSQAIIQYSLAVPRGTIPIDGGQAIILDTLSKLSEDAGRNYDYAVLKNGIDDFVRIDKFFHAQAERLREAFAREEEVGRRKYFVGEAYGRFDGIIQAVDLKGEAPEARLILSAGQIPISCVIVGMDLDAVRLALGNRVLVSGRAIYEGETGLPSRIEIREFTVVVPDDLRKWQGGVTYSPLEGVVDEE